MFQFQPDCLSLGVSIPRPLQFQSDCLSLGASLLQNNRDQRTPITHLFQTRNFLVPNKDLTCLQQASQSPTGTSLLATSKFCSESNRHLLVCNKQVGGRWAQKTPLGVGLGVLHSHQRYGHSHKIILARVIFRRGGLGGLRHPVGCARHFWRLPAPAHPCYAVGILCATWHGVGFAPLAPQCVPAMLQTVHRLAC